MIRSLLAFLLTFAPQYTVPSHTGATAASGGSPVTFVNDNGAAFGDGPTTTFTIDTGTNLVAFMEVAYTVTGSGSISGITINGTSMASCGAAAGSTGTEFVQVWQLANPTTGASVSTTITAAGTIANIKSNVVVFSGVNQAAPCTSANYQSTTGTGSGCTNTTTVPANDLGLGAIGTNVATFNINGTNQTSTGISNPGSLGGAGDYGSPSGGTVVDTWTFGGSTTYACVGVDIAHT